MNKRFASLAVSALLLVSLLSVPALAEGTEAAADTVSDDHVIVTLNPEAALQPETPAEAAASATETAQADPVPSAYDAASAATAAKAEVKADGTKDEQLTYVALGDSIVSGVGLADVQYSARSGYSVDMTPNFQGYSPNCYVGKVAAALGLDRDHAINLGLPALTAPDLADMIRYGKMPQMNMASGCEYNYPEFQDYIRKADVVSVQIGSNDAFVPCIVALGNATNWKSEQLVATMVSLESALLRHEQDLRRDLPQDHRSPHLHRAGDPQSQPGCPDHPRGLHQPCAAHPLLAQLLQQAEQV